MRHKKVFKFGPEQKCKNPKCEKMIPIPQEFCSSICWRECHEPEDKVEVQKKKEALEVYI